MYLLGNRICIIGPSSCGKSTLAEKIARIKGIALLHLDQAAHIPHTDWERKPFEEFRQIHDDFIAADAWVIEGNYHRLMPQRFARADTVIFHKFNRFGCLYRFIRRAFLNSAERPGKLEGSRDHLNFEMINHICRVVPQNYQLYEHYISQNPGLNVILIKSFSQADRLVEEAVLSQKNHERRV